MAAERCSRCTCCSVTRCYPLHFPSSTPSVSVLFSTTRHNSLHAGSTTYLGRFLVLAFPSVPICPGVGGGERHHSWIWEDTPTPLGSVLEDAAAPWQHKNTSDGGGRGGDWSDAATSQGPQGELAAPGGWKGQGRKDPPRSLQRQRAL